MTNSTWHGMAWHPASCIVQNEGKPHSAMRGSLEAQGRQAAWTLRPDNLRSARKSLAPVSHKIFLSMFVFPVSAPSNLSLSLRGSILATQLYNTKESATEALRQSSGHSHQSVFQKIDPCISVHYFFLPHLKADALNLDIVFFTI